MNPKNGPKYVIGMDYGTQSARVMLLDTADGNVLKTHTVSYPHGTGEENLVDVRDYDAALSELLEAVCLPEYREDIVGICVDATSLTFVPLGTDGKALGYDAQIGRQPQAQIKLWKRHQAHAQAEEALLLARQYDERFLARTGGSISSEWMLPKILEMIDEDPGVYERMDRAMDLCEYLTFQLTGTPVRSVGSMCYKCLWAQDLGFPSEGYLNALRPGLGKRYAHLLRGTVLRPGDAAGALQASWCERLGLSRQVMVAAGVLDGHTSLVAMGALEPGDAALVVGTSNVLTVQTTTLHEMSGICGIAKDGLTPGLYGIDSGQNCTGDMLAWYLKNALPKEEWEQAALHRVSIHQWMMQQVQKPWQNSVIAADWWNGSRNAPCDLSLRGAMMGLSLETRPAEMYLALLQSVVCGSREILELCQDDGMEIRRIMIGGGIANKNPLFMDQYANLLGRSVLVADAAEVPAIGAAILAAVAAGCYETPLQAYTHMGIRTFKVYAPNPLHAQDYEQLYQKNRLLRKLICKNSRDRNA